MVTQCFWILGISLWLLNDTREIRVPSPRGFLVLLTQGFKKNSDGNSRMILLEFKRKTKQTETRVGQL